MPKVIVVGSGLAGLSTAGVLAKKADCTVLERLPVSGGEDWEEPRVAQLYRDAVNRGVRFLPATTALRWNGNHLLAIGQCCDLLHADAIVVATGHRPFTRAELGLEGSRCGGVVSGTVALHLTRSGVVLGERPVVLGSGRLGRKVAAQMLKAHSDVRMITPEHLAREDTRDMPWPVLSVARPLAVAGGPRIRALVCLSDEGEMIEYDCDSLVLAHGRVPYRNIDGAIFRGPRVAFAQNADGSEIESEWLGQLAAKETLTLLSRECFADESTSVQPRIGPPQ
jgi:D-hydroxyproline dehydrogenase subunit alpha